MKMLYMLPLLAIPFFLFFTERALAATCQPFYGGGITCTNGQLSLDKQIQNPQNGMYLDTLTGDDPHFQPNQTVMFRLTVKNTGKTKLSSIRLIDTLPSTLVFVSGNGNYDNAQKTVTISLDSLQGGESKSFPIQAKIASPEKLPSNQSTFCVANLATATSGLLISSDTTNLCITNNIGTSMTNSGQTVMSNRTSSSQNTVPGEKYPIYPTPKNKKSPPTGPNTISFILLISAALCGLRLRKFTKQKSAY